MEPTLSATDLSITDTTPESRVERLERLMKTVDGVKAKRVILRKLKAARKKLRVEEEAETLRTQIVKCRECSLGRTRTRAVPYSGPTHGQADLVIVGEAPGDNEDRTGTPFVGRSGRKLDTLIKKAGSDRDRMFVCNTLCCRPPENRDPKRDELDACRPNFDAQLLLADVPVGVTLGAYAFAAVMEQSRGSVSMGEIVGEVYWRRGMIWVPAYHPAYALRQPWAGDTIYEALVTAIALRRGRMRPPIPPWDQVEIEGRSLMTLEEGLTKVGWVLMHSEVLGCQILVVDESFKKMRGPKIPGKLAHLPRYEMSELIAMGMLSKRGELDKRELQAIHMVKHEFGGKVMLDG